MRSHSWSLGLKFPLALGAALWAFTLSPPQVQGGPIQDALDTANLVFTTGGTGGIGWFLEPQNGLFGDNTFDGVDAARAGRIDDLGETWMQTEVVGPGTITFWWQAYSEPDADFLSFYIGETLMESLSGLPPGWPSGWQYRSFDVPPGTNLLRWIYAKDFDFTGGTQDTAWVDHLAYRQTPPPTPGQALGCNSLNWTSGGNSNPTEWFGESTVVYDGTLAVQSGDIFHDQTNWLQTTIEGITNVSFFWKVSSETNHDFLEFFTNNVLAKRISGEVNWQSNSFRFAPNTTNTLTWSYRRDDSITSGSNCGWVDGLALSPSPTPEPTPPFELGPPAMLPDGRFQLSVIGNPGATFRIMMSTDLINWSQLSTVVATGAVTHVVDSTAPASPARFYRAVTP
jgi:hypothetical protein